MVTWSVTSTAWLEVSLGGILLCVFESCISLKVVNLLLFFNLVYYDNCTLTQQILFAEWLV